MGNSVLERVTSARYLGLTIDDKLNWKIHVKELCKSIAQCCNYMYKLRYYVPMKSRKSIYYSLFYSRVTYGIMCWGTASQNTLNSLKIFQNKIIKAMFFKPIYYRTLTLLHEHELLNINDILNYEVAKHVHKYYSGQLPTIFETNFRTISSRHDHNTRSSARNDIVVTRTGKSLGECSTKVLGAKVWNKIPTTIRSSTFNHFRKQYKTWLTEKYI